MCVLAVLSDPGVSIRPTRREYKSRPSAVWFTPATAAQNAAEGTAQRRTHGHGHGNGNDHGNGHGNGGGNGGRHSRSYRNPQSVIV